MASGYYDITSKTLGRGHYGVVKLGRHCLTGEPVAIKIIEKSRLNSDSLNQLGTEIRILFRLSEYEHPNILKLYQTIDSEDKLYLVTEYCGPHACDLHDYMSRKMCRDGLSEIEAQIFFIQISSAISYCHSMGIVHRDLKPENILVTDYKHVNSKFSSINCHPVNKNHSGNIIDNNNHIKQQQYPLLKLIDFGFANQWYPDEKMRTSCGTLAYSAPELLLGEPYDGTKVDVWGLGLMLYILLYGGNPFMQINDNETLTKILDCSFSTPKRNNVDYNAIELLRSLIKRNPDSRLPMDAILKHRWFASIPKSFETILLNYRIDNDSVASASMHSNPSTPSVPCATPVQAPKQQPQLAAKMNASQNVGSILPSISELGPLRNLNKSMDDSTNGEHVDKATNRLKYNRTRSLSITRTHHGAQLQQSTSLTHTRSSLSLEKNHGQISTPTRAASLYRPTSPDVGGTTIVPTEEESRLHDSVVQEMFRLTKFIDSKSSIEASLKNARFTHRQFNRDSIKPAAINKRKLASSLAKFLGHKNDDCPNQVLPNPSAAGECCREAGSKSGSSGDAECSKVEKACIVNTKLSNDDYIYATYQLTRDRILRVKQEELDSMALASEHGKSSAACLGAERGANKLTDEGGDRCATKDDQVVAKENSNLRLAYQRKLLQPQHKMRDKFTSFFRPESTSPNGSFNVSGESQGACGGSSSASVDLFTNQASLLDVHHEAFSEHNNEHSASLSSPYYASKADTQDSSLAYSLPLARKCSLVCEESGCSNEITES